jgi:hypothetical protein
MREEQRRPPPRPLVGACPGPPEGPRRLAEEGNVDRGERGIDCGPEAGAVDEDQGRNASRLGERQAEGYEAAERVTDERCSPYAQSIEKSGCEPLEEGGRVSGVWSGAVGGAEQVWGVDAVSGCQVGNNPSPVEGVVPGAAQQHQGRTFARTKIADGQPVNLEILLFDG